MTIAHKLILLYLIPFFICYSILSAKPVQYQVENAAGFVATTVYIPAAKTKDIQKTGYLFDENDMNQCLAWGKNAKEFERGLIKANENKKDDNYYIIYLSIGIVLGIFAGYGLGKIIN